MAYAMTGEMARRCMRAIGMLLGMAVLAGCSSPVFVDPPPAALLVPLPKKVEGVWANERENGQRVRFSGRPDGTLDMIFFSVPPEESEEIPPMLMQTIHFDHADWIVVAENEHAKPENFRFVKFELETPLRLCGSELDSQLFAEAIESGQLKGKVERSGPMQQLNVKVTSPSFEWMKWWSGLPEDRKTLGPKWCFRRAG